MMFQALDRIDRKLRVRLEEVAMKADRFGERGIVDWAKRATQDALMLGKLRDRDVAALERLEDTFGHDFYNGNGAGSRGNPLYA
jgi:hypothetical protein